MQGSKVLRFPLTDFVPDVRPQHISQLCRYLKIRILTSQSLDGFQDPELTCLQCLTQPLMPGIDVIVQVGKLRQDVHMRLELLDCPSGAPACACSLGLNGLHDTLMTSFHALMELKQVARCHHIVLASCGAKDLTLHKGSIVERFKDISLAGLDAFLHTSVAGFQSLMEGSQMHLVVVSNLPQSLQHWRMVHPRGRYSRQHLLMIVMESVMQRGNFRSNFSP
mmetsp:Transcript_117706/g.227027  ORF Transcript_117706/g.227027 Transcript_117706/m.227027 type:complete len:222 (-) Transcript_117706:1408-2073(-)